MYFEVIEDVKLLFFIIPFIEYVSAMLKDKFQLDSLFIIHSKCLGYLV